MGEERVLMSAEEVRCEQSLSQSQRRRICAFHMLAAMAYLLLLSHLHAKKYSLSTPGFDMETDQVDEANNGTSSHSLLSSILPHLRPFVKLLCRIIALIDSRTQKQSERLLSVASYIYGLIEIPLLLVFLFYGAIFSFVTAIIAIPIIVIQSAIVFWPVIVSISLEIVTGLWRGFQQLCLDSGQNSDGTPDESAWPALDIPEDFLGSNAELDTANGTSLADIMGYDPNDVLEFGDHALGSWKVSDTVEESPRRSSLTSDLRISTSPFRVHHRRGTGSSTNLSVSSSPDVVRTPMLVNDEAGDGTQSRHRSGSSSPEQLFRMTALSDARRAQSTSDLRRHNRSGSSSTTSLRSVGRIRGLDRL